MKPRVSLVLVLLLVGRAASAQVVGQGPGGSSAWKVTFGGAAQPVTVSSGSVTFTNTSLAVTNTGTFAVQATLGAETTKVIGTVNIAAAQSVAITGSVAVTNANLDAALSTLLASSTFTGRINTQGQKAMSASTPVVVASDQSAIPVSGTVTTSPPANASTNLAQVAGTTTDTNSGVKSAGTLRVVLATDQPALTNKLLVTPDSVALPANQSVNQTQWAGTAVDVNSGTKSAGTVRVVLATDQPALTNKLLVTPDSVALPANQSVNVNQIVGTTADVNSGSKSAGTLRVVLATDQPALTNKLLVTPDSVALPANQSVNVNQINGVTPLMGNGVTGTGAQRVTIASDNTAFPVNATLSAETTKVIGTVNQGTSPWVGNTTQFGSVNLSTGRGASGTGIPRVTASEEDLSAAYTLNSAGTCTTMAASTTVTLAGMTGGGWYIAAGTLAATIVPEASVDGGTTWAVVIETRNGAQEQSAGIAYTNPNTASSVNPYFGTNTSAFRLRCSSYTSGSADFNVRATKIVSPLALCLSCSVPGLAQNIFVNSVGGTDGVLARAIQLRSARPSAADYGVLVRPLMPTNGTQDMPTMDAAARAGFLELTDGTNTTAVKAASTAAAATDPAVVVSLSPNSPVPLPTLTKGTQGSTGASVQDLHDAGRTLVTFTADNVTPILTTDTIVTFSKLVGDTVTASQTTYAVTSGKTLRLTHLSFSMIPNSTTVAYLRVRLRQLSSGACTVAAGHVVGVWGVSSPPGTIAANAGGALNQSIDFPEGIEFSGATMNVCLSMNVLGAAAQTVNITAIGYEY